MLDTLVLTEHRPVFDVPLERWQVDALRTALPDLRLTPSLRHGDRWDLLPGSTVGSLDVGGWPVEIWPKVKLDRVLFLLSYALDAVRWRDEEVALATADRLVEALAELFSRQVDAVLRPGVLQGYRSEDEALPTVRGQIRFGDQVRRRYGDRLPVECTFDEFTEDVIENRLLKAALHRLGRFALDPGRPALRRLRHADLLLEQVTLMPFPPRHVPSVHWTRLNARYRPAVELARLILSTMSPEQGSGDVRTSGFLVNMNTVFEDFLVAALRQHLDPSVGLLVQGGKGRSLHLDSDQRIGLAPDLSWWRGGTCVLVGDAKYKRLSATGIKHPDLYQLLAYLVATGLRHGVLVYPKTEAEPADHHVPGLDVRLLVRTIPLEGEPDEILAGVSAIARELEALRSHPIPV